MTTRPRHVLQLCHSYDPPFDDCARQYASLFKGTSFLVTTVFLTGATRADLLENTLSDEVIFLESPKHKLKGLKLSLLKRVKRISQQKHYELCIAHRTKPTYLALIATQLPVMSIHHAFGDFDRLGRRLFTEFFSSRLLLIGVSKAVSADIKQHLPRFPVDGIETLYNRVDIEHSKNELLSKAKARAMLDIPDESYVIGNVGRLHPDKDQETLIRAFAKAKHALPENTLLIIIGKGKLQQKLHDLAQSLNVEDNIKFIGYIKDAKRYFTAFDIFVLTSDSEPFGMVVLEAMIANLPIICSDCGGAKEIVENTGLLFPFASSEKLAELLVHSANNRESTYSHDASLMKLHTYFSDEAGRRAFWKLEQIKKILSP